MTKSIDTLKSEVSASIRFQREERARDEEKNARAPGGLRASLNQGRLDYEPSLQSECKAAHETGGAPIEILRAVDAFDFAGTYLTREGAAASCTKGINDAQPRGPANVRFTRDWQAKVSGNLREAKEVTFEYDLARLRQCRASYIGLPAWGTVMKYRFDDGEEKSAGLTVQGQGTMNPQAATLSIPTDAKRLTVWFLNTDAAGCVAWDSHFSENFRFDL
jgi:hypothetical protein